MLNTAARNKWPSDKKIGSGILIRSIVFGVSFISGIGIV